MLLQMRGVIQQATIHSDSDCEAQEHIVLDTIDVGGFFLSVVIIVMICVYQKYDLPSVPEL